MDLVSPPSETINRSEDVYESEQFTLIVGKNPNPQFVHKAILCQSPVIAKLCDSDFKESHEKRIILPHDDAEVFGRVLRYLYTHAYEPSPAATENFVMLANDLADAYVMADKYQLNLLKADLVHMFRHRELDGCGMGGISHDNDALLSAIQRIYGSVPGTNQEFRTYFKEVAPSFLLRANNFESINDCLDDNVFYGLLGRDLFEAAMEALKLEAKHRAKAMDNSRNKRAKGIRRSE